MISPDANALYHPSSEQDIIDLIQYASQNDLQVRVRGAAQSIAAAVVADASGGAISNINMELDQIRQVTFDDANMQVTVGAGCNLGWDPFDPSGTSRPDTMANNNVPDNLLFQLNQKGWSIQNVPDAIHQTVAGFISTGSSGGTMMHSFDECIVSIRLIDGTGTAQTFTKSVDPNNNFYAVACSMGLLGVITSVTLQCTSAFNIIGQEMVSDYNDAEFDFLGPGNNEKPSLQTYLSTTEFSRTLWWPYPSLKRVIAWKARTIQSSDYNQQTGIPPNFTPKPYKPLFPLVFGSTLPSEMVAGTGYRLIATYPQWLYDIFGNSSDYNMIKSVLDLICPYLYPLMINMYFPLTSASNPIKQFWDYWNSSLPMDTVEFSNNLFNLVYTEFWVPASQAQTVVNTMETYYQSQGFSNVSYYTVELLAAKSSNFWMSPAYMQDSVRFNIMRFDVGGQQDLSYFQIFWDLFKSKNISFRLHWGKFLPPPNSNENPSFISSQYPKWNDFLNFRKQMDPKNIFLNTYWKSQLGIS
jgi:D-arabinono-1,4-lactone oxidase/FAD binding domain